MKDPGIRQKTNLKEVTVLSNNILSPLIALRTAVQGSTNPAAPSNGQTFNNSSKGAAIASFCMYHPSSVLELNLQEVVLG